MRETFHVKVILRAAEITGGAVTLSQALGVSLHQVQVWMRGETPIPDVVMGRLLDTITDDTLRRLGNDCRVGSKTLRGPKT